MRAVVEAFNRRDVDSLASLFSADAEIVPVSAELEETAYRGPDAACEWCSAVDATWAGLSVEIQETRSSVDLVLGLGRIKGQGRESGAAIDVEAAAIARVRDGLITRLRTYTDRERALEAFRRGP